MKRNYLFLIGFFLSTIVGFSQISSTILPTPNLAADEDLESKNAFKTQLKRLKKSDKGFEKSLQYDEYTIPVVVHVIHDGETGNISDEQIEAGIVHLNEAFANVNGEGVDTKISFCLAKQDPDGMLTNGIVRIESALTDMHKSQDPDVKNLSRWNTNDYLNIWLVNSVTSSSGPGVIGYAYMPSSHGLEHDGVVMEAAYFGSNAVNSTVIVHELGHYLGLFHTFEASDEENLCKNDECDEDGDMICDTPPEKTSDHNYCGSNATNYNSCSSDADDERDINPFRPVALGGLGDQPDMAENYMDYSDLVCYTKFTEGQKEAMQTVLETTRLSLLESIGCQNPCFSPITSSFNSVGEDAVLGAATVFPCNAVNTSNYSWKVNGDIVSESDMLIYTFLNEGTHLLTLELSNDDVNCTEVITKEVNVVCGAIPSFIADNLNVEPGETVNFINQSTNATGYSWMVNNIVTATTTDYSFLPATTGQHIVKLTAHTDICSSESLPVVVNVYETVPEICDNERDDDGDGLVDSYDPDCPCLIENATCANQGQSFFGICDSCEYIPSREMAYELERMWETTINTTSVSMAWVGDVEGDCIPEVLVTQRYTGSKCRTIHFLNSETGEIKYSITNLNTLINYGTIAIADVDRDRNLDVFFITTEPTNNLVRYEFDGENSFVKVYTSTEEIATYESFYEWTNDGFGFGINIADINSDGIPEISIGNQIFNSVDGSLICQGLPDQSIGRNTHRSELSVGYGGISYSILADVLPDDFCPSCSGLELVAGNQVYSIAIPYGSAAGTGIIEPVVDMSEFFEDGISSVVDIDADGELDILTTAKIDAEIPVSPYDVTWDVELFAWNPRTATILARTEEIDLSKNGGPGRIAAGDIDGTSDNDVELVLRTVNSLIVLKYNATTNEFDEIARKVVDDYSETSVTLFDFNGDGAQEVVYRDEDSLRIFEGTTLNVVAVEECSSSTMSEYPVIADINGDGPPEILIAGSEHMICFTNKTPGKPWMPARKVWNQFSFMGTNINDDMSIPVQQQSGVPYKVTNTFMAQMGYYDKNGDPVFPAPDATIDIVSVSCNGENVELIANIGNNGIRNLVADMPVAIYDQNPYLNTDANLITRVTINQVVASGEVVAISLPVTNIGNTTMYAVINDDGSFAQTQAFPVTAYGECNFMNNIDSIVVNFSAPTLDLGGDKTICSNGGTTTLNAGDGFETYLWDDGNTRNLRTVSEPGIYSVTVTDICGNEQEDEIEVTIDDTEMDYIDELFISCEDNGQTEITLFGFEDFEISPETDVDYSVYPTLVFTPTATTSYTIRGFNENGCRIEDDFDVVVESCSNCSVEAGTDVTICEGESVQLSAITSECLGGNPVSGCGQPEIPQVDCSMSSRSITGSDWQSVNAGEIVSIDAGTTFTGSVNMNGGTLIICGTCYLQNINFNSGDIIILGTADIPNINMNNSASKLINYGTLDFTIITFNGTIENHGVATVHNFFNINQSTSHFINTNSFTAENNFTNSQLAENDGTISVIGEFINNGTGTFNNSCTITTTGKFQNDAQFTNDGSIDVGSTTYLNDGTIYFGAGSILSTSDIHINAGVVGSTDGCARINVAGNSTINNAASITGMIDYCDPNGIETLDIILDKTITTDCSCIASGNNTGGSGGVITYSWNPASNIDDATSASPTVSPQTTTTYEVLVVDAEGNMATDEITVTVEECNNGGTLTVVPNPVSSTADIFVDAPDATQASVKLINSQGWTMYQSTVQANQTDILWLQGLAPGTYTLEVTANNYYETMILVKSE